jgi:hypothetical protein
MKRTDLTRAVELLGKGDWQAAHEIVQRDEDSPHACWAHAIVHLMEGDGANARYWFTKAGRPYGEDVAAEIAALSASLQR